MTEADAHHKVAGGDVGMPQGMQPGTVPEQMAFQTGGDPVQQQKHRVEHQHQRGGHKHAADPPQSPVIPVVCQGREGEGHEIHEEDCAHGVIFHTGYLVDALDNDKPENGDTCQQEPLLGESRGLLPQRIAQQQKTGNHHIGLCQIVADAGE